MKQASRTSTSAAANLRLVSGIGLVDLYRPDLGERLAGTVSDQLEQFAAQVRHGLFAASVSIGLEVMGELLEAEVTDVAGPKGKHNPGRTGYRHGSEDGKVTLRGRLGRMKPRENGLLTAIGSLPFCAKLCQIPFERDHRRR
jgi:hypothetical protein